MEKSNRNNLDIVKFDLPGDCNPDKSVNQEHIENSLTGNDIGAQVACTPEELAKQKEKNPIAVRGVIKSSITGLLENSSKIIAKSSLAYERNQRKIGVFLKEASRTFKKKSEFMAWLRENFKQHLRTLEEAQYLAGLGRFAIDFEGIGKNSLLAFARIRHDDVVVEFMKKKPAPVVNPDEDKTPLKNYAHTVTIFKRFDDEGITLTPEQATAIATRCNKALEIKSVKKMAEQIHAQPTGEKGDFIAKWIEGGCPIEREKSAKKFPSLAGIVAQFKDFPKKYDLNDAAILSGVSEADVRDAYLFVWTLAQKIKINLSPPNQEDAQSESGETDDPELTNVVQLVQEKIAEAS